MTCGQAPDAIGEVVAAEPSRPGALDAANTSCEYRDPAVARSVRQRAGPNRGNLNSGKIYTLEARKRRMRFAKIFRFAGGGRMRETLTVQLNVTTAYQR